MFYDIEPQQIWFTADLHFWHGGILSEYINLASRRERWSSVEQMNADLLAEWRRTVGPHDVVFHLGDLFYRCGVEKVEALLRELSGYRIILSPGNHDWRILRRLVARNALPPNVSVLPEWPVLFDRRIDNRLVFLDHFPPRSGMFPDGVPDDSILLHGHSHGQRPPDESALDVGWDAHQRFLTWADIHKHFSTHRAD